MSLRKRWKSVDGGELLDAVDEKSLGQLVPQSSGVYLWRRRINAPSGGRLSVEECIEWIGQLATEPSARISPRSITHCVSMDGLTIGGGGLTDDKAATLGKVSKNKQVRQKLTQCVESLSDFMPVIYFGESSDLYARVRQHLDGATGLKSYIREQLGLEWPDVEFRFLVLSEKSDTSEDMKKFQQLIEMMAQRLLAPFATERPG